LQKEKCDLCEKEFDEDDIIYRTDEGNFCSDCIVELNDYK